MFYILYILDASEAAQARLKGLDNPGPVVTVKAPPKDVNTYQNNQTKFSAGAGTIPSDQIKCNILKAKRDEEMKKAGQGKKHLSNFEFSILTKQL